MPQRVQNLGGPMQICDNTFNASCSKSGLKHYHVTGWDCSCSAEMSFGACFRDQLCLWSHTNMFCSCKILFCPTAEMASLKTT